MRQLRLTTRNGAGIIADSRGFTILTRSHSAAYWGPWCTWVPLSVRQRRHWWGALRIYPVERTTP